MLETKETKIDRRLVISTAGNLRYIRTEVPVVLGSTDKHRNPAKALLFTNVISSVWPLHTCITVASADTILVLLLRHDRLASLLATNYPIGASIIPGYISRQSPSAAPDGTDRLVQSTTHTHI